MKPNNLSEEKIKSTLLKTKVTLEAIVSFVEEFDRGSLSLVLQQNFYERLASFRETLFHLQRNTSDMISSLENKNEEVTQLQSEIQELQRRLHELEAFEKRSTQDGGVFISYSHADKDFVNEIVKEFETDKINYWLDDKDLFIGQVIDKAISDGIQKSWIFITVLSPSSVNSRWVEREFDEASHEEVEGRKIILPVVCNNLPADKVPARIRRKLYVDLSKDFPSGYQKLKKSILHYLEEYKKNQK
ncbi:MAG TPA: TIR domain-containing protein [Anaerolineales bacterium]|nr:TIR domain-containing protein [Anaerolineales bacterium]HND48515.1 TIR domain-containing protein [Anaerolineales bacterium]